jgi:hypothetical protein
VRLLKCAYKEPASVAHQRKADVDSAYVTLMETLLKRGAFPAIATHDEAIIAHARAFVAREQIAKDRFEFQMLYGIRRDLQTSLVAEGYGGFTTNRVAASGSCIYATTGRTAGQRRLRDAEHVPGKLKWISEPTEDTPDFGISGFRIQSAPNLWNRRILVVSFLPNC